jgi:hypothetical protein
MKKATIITTITLTVEVEGNYSPEFLGTFYTSNGDPGDPPEPSEYEITSIKLLSGTDITKILDDNNFDWQVFEQDCIAEIENEIANNEKDYDDVGL